VLHSRLRLLLGGPASKGRRSFLPGAIRVRERNPPSAFVSAAKHILVPRAFASAADVPRAALARFHHMTTTERDALRREGRIERLAAKLWRWKDIDVTGPSSESGIGLVSLEVDWRLQQALRSDMWSMGRPTG